VKELEGRGKGDTRQKVGTEDQINPKEKKEEKTSGGRGKGSKSDSKVENAAQSVPKKDPQSDNFLVDIGRKEEKSEGSKRGGRSVPVGKGGNWKKENGWIMKGGKREWRGFQLHKRLLTRDSLIH